MDQFKKKLKGNKTKYKEIPYKPIPEVVPPGIVTDPDSINGKNNVDYEDVKRMRGWEQQNKL